MSPTWSKRSGVAAGLLVAGLGCQTLEIGRDPADEPPPGQEQGPDQGFDFRGYLSDPVQVSARFPESYEGESVFVRVFRPNDVLLGEDVATIADGRIYQLFAGTGDGGSHADLFVDVAQTGVCQPDRAWRVGRVMEDLSVLMLTDQPVDPRACDSFPEPVPTDVFSVTFTGDDFGLAAGTQLAARVTRVNGARSAVAVTMVEEGGAVELTIPWLQSGARYVVDTVLTDFVTQCGPDLQFVWRLDLGIVTHDQAHDISIEDPFWEGACYDRIRYGN